MRPRLLLVLAMVLLTGAEPALAREPVRPRRDDAAASRVAPAREAARRRLADLLTGLWPDQAAALAGGDAVDWAEADRRAVWTRMLLEAVRPSRAAVPGRPAEGEPAQVAPSPSVASLSPPPPASSDAAFSENLASRVRGLDQSGTKPLPRATPQALDRALGAAPPSEEAATDAGSAVFTPPEGGLSWPVRGKVATSFAPSARPSRQGIVLAAPPGSPVSAAAGGRVVFSGALRGLGRMLIVSHGDRRHTVYACLAQVDVAVDDIVAKDAVLGRSGFCAPAKTAGLYFELRFQEKALNPAEWFAARQ